MTNVTADGVVQGKWRREGWEGAGGADAWYGARPKVAHNGVMGEAGLTLA